LKNVSEGIDKLKNVGVNDQQSVDFQCKYRQELTDKEKKVIFSLFGFYSSLYVLNEVPLFKSCGIEMETPLKALCRWPLWRSWNGKPELNLMNDVKVDSPRFLLYCCVQYVFIWEKLLAYILIWNEKAS
jgi:hypothetical protein